MRLESNSTILPVLFLMVLSHSPVIAEAPTDVARLAEDNTAFAVDLYHKLGTGEGNLFLSPYSISVALAMAYLGARGNTEKQMAEALHFSLSQSRLHPGFAELEAKLNEVQKKGNVELNVANSLWPQEKYRFLEEYLILTREYYGVHITPVDFIGAGEAARNVINRWVEGKTQNKIRDLIPPNSFDIYTRLVLVNAIYFKGKWRSRFAAGNTREAPFFLSSKKSVQTLMMAQLQTFRYAKFESLQVLELPYVGEELSMFVFLPRAVNGLGKLESGLTVDILKQWKSRLSATPVRVFLPKFTMTSQFNLNRPLASMGMADAFSEKIANFAGMDGQSNWLHIQAAIHQAFVDVDEEGTTAAAATAVVGGGFGGPPPPPPTFRADHPFLFLIQENKTGSILFMGRVTYPTTTAQ